MRVNRHFNDTATKVVKSKFVFTLVSFYTLPDLARSLPTYTGLRGGIMLQTGPEGSLTAANCYPLHMLVKDPGRTNITAVDRAAHVHVMLRSLTQLSILCRELVLGRTCPEGQSPRRMRYELYLAADKMHNPSSDESFLSVFQDNLWSFPNMTIFGARNAVLARKILDTIALDIPSVPQDYHERMTIGFKAMQRALRTDTKDLTTVATLFQDLFDYSMRVLSSPQGSQWLEGEADSTIGMDNPDLVFHFYRVCRVICDLLVMEAFMRVDTPESRRRYARHAAAMVAGCENGQVSGRRFSIQRRVRNHNRHAIMQISLGEFEEATRIMDCSLQLDPFDDFALHAKSALVPLIGPGLEMDGRRCHELAGNLYLSYKDSVLVGMAEDPEFPPKSI